MDIPKADALVVSTQLSRPGLQRLPICGLEAPV